MAFDKAALLAARTSNVRPVKLAGFGELTVRGLTRAEVLSIQDSGVSDRAALEARMVSIALVDPAMTEDEVVQWQNVAPAAELAPAPEAKPGKGKKLAE